jgi:hypothetical protein
VGNGSPLVTMECGAAAGWDIFPGSGSVILTGTSFAMDAGVPGNNGLLKVCQAVRPSFRWAVGRIGRERCSIDMTWTNIQTWTSYPGLAAQTWYLTTDGRIAITGGNQCLDEGANGEFPFRSHPFRSHPFLSLGTSASFTIVTRSWIHS